MANANGWGDGASNNNIGWGKGADNAIGWGSVYSVSSAGATDIVGTPAVDPDAQAFITAASITDPTQQSAINTLVTDLKGYNIWTKFKAIYPIVGGSASSHAVNLKTPGTYNLTFATGWTHASTGMTPNGATYADTALNPSSALTLNSTHLSFYSRTNVLAVQREIAIYQAGDNPTMALGTGSGTEISDHYNYNQRISASIASSTGFYIAIRTTSTNHKLYKNNTTLGTNTSANVNVLPNGNLFIGAANNTTLGVISSYSTKQCAFASIGDGLTDAEAANFYTAVQNFQVTLGRSIGTQTVSDADAQAFVNAANITDQVEANAINNLVIGMKADSLWTKMKAIYPVVGGVSSSHAVNLKTPGTFNLTFSSGWTHSSTGMTPLNAFANTALIPNSVLSLNSVHISGYLRTNLQFAGPIISAEDAGTYNNGLYIWPKQSTNQYSVRINDNGLSGVASAPADIRGLHIATRTASNIKKYRLNNTELFNSNESSTGLNTSSIYLGASRNNANYNGNQLAFASIGDGLTDTDATNLYNRVNTFQVTLNRNV